MCAKSKTGVALRVGTKVPQKQPLAYAPNYVTKSRVYLGKKIICMTPFISLYVDIIKIPFLDK